MKKIKKHKSQIIFHLILNLIIGIFITFSSYYNLPLNSKSDYAAFFFHFIILQYTVFGFLYLISLNKYIFYLIFPFFFIVYSLFSYWVYMLDISVTDSIIQAVIETKLDIAIDLITLPLFIYCLLIFVVLIAIIKLYKNVKVNQLKSPLLILAIVAFVTFFMIENYRYGTFIGRLPYNLTLGIVHYFQKSEAIKFAPINSNIKKAETNINVVFIIGESVRADHLQINGYNRNTTPFLSQNKSVVSYPGVYTPLTNTAKSLPQILTNLSINQAEISSVYSIYSILKQLNFKTTWIGNQTPEKSYNSFIEENETIKLIDPYHSFLSFSKSLDEELLPPLESALQNDSNQFITVHMIGSHWWYENRYSSSFRKFKPEMDSKHIPSLSKEQIINSYDNTILYLDDFLKKAVSIIMKSSKKTILIYLSDHGEILGENGKWLHAQEDEASTNPAMIVWYSKEFEQAFPEKTEYLKSNALKKISTDFFFNSILDLIEVENFEYIRSESIFSNRLYND